MATTDFGFKTVDEQEKARRVRGVFDSVASKYDIMNDLMSLGLHRAWKAYTVMVANVKPGQKVLDIAGGTGDMAMAFAGKVGARGQVVHTDINLAMLKQGRDRLTDKGILLPTTVCDAEQLPFADAHFDLVCVAFGLRNMTHKDRALQEMARVLKPGGKLLVLEFSKIAPPLAKAYDWYRLKSCRVWAIWWPQTLPVTGTWPNLFACIQISRRSKPLCKIVVLPMWIYTT